MSEPTQFLSASCDLCHRGDRNSTGWKMHLKIDTSCWLSESSTLFTLVSPEEKLCKDPCSSNVLQNSSLNQMNMLKKDHCSLGAFVIGL